MLLVDEAGRTVHTGEPRRRTHVLVRVGIKGVLLTQISAAQATLDKVALGLLDDHAHHCVIGAEDSDRDAKTDELMAAGGRLMHRG